MGIREVRCGSTLAAAVLLRILGIVSSASGEDACLAPLLRKRFVRVCADTANLPFPVDSHVRATLLGTRTHHAITVNIRGNSYRLKDKLKAGLLKPVEATT